MLNMHHVFNLFECSKYSVRLPLYTWLLWKAVRLDTLLLDGRVALAGVTWLGVTGRAQRSVKYCQLNIR